MEVQYSFSNILNIIFYFCFLKTMLYLLRLKKRNTSNMEHRKFHEHESRGNSGNPLCWHSRRATRNNQRAAGEQSPGQESRDVLKCTRSIKIYLAALFEQTGGKIYKHVKINKRECNYLFQSKANNNRPSLNLVQNYYKIIIM